MGEIANEIVDKFFENGWIVKPRKIKNRNIITVEILRRRERSWFVRFEEYKFYLPISCIKVLKKNEESVTISIPKWLWKKKKEEMSAQRKKMEAKQKETIDLMFLG